MKITICGSIAFHDEMQDITKKLEDLGHEVKLPPAFVTDENGNSLPVKQYYEMRKSETNNNSWIWDEKEKAIKAHFDKVEWCDAILVLNYDKNDIPNYLGANTLMEVGLALHLGKKIFLLNPIPEMSYKEEILGCKPIVINQDLSKIL